MSGEFYKPSPHTEDDVAEQAARAAEELITSPEAGTGTVTVDAISPAVMARNEAEQQVERLVDTGQFNYDDAWRKVDDGGKIRKAYDDEILARQASVNQVEAEAIRHAIHKARLAVLGQAEDSEESARAKVRLLAEKRAADERRGRRW